MFLYPGHPQCKSFADPFVAVKLDVVALHSYYMHLYAYVCMCTSGVVEMRRKDAGWLVQIFGTSVIAGVCVCV